jgi:hypothetical protein
VPQATVSLKLQNLRDLRLSRGRENEIIPTAEQIDTGEWAV